MRPYASFGYSSVTYQANKIAFIGLDKQGNIEWVKTINKEQSDVNTDQFIGYGTVSQDMGTSFLYYKKEKGIRQFEVNTLTVNGQLAKGNNIILNEKQFEWMPRALKQVSNNEAIIPYQFKNNIGFAKIQIK